MLGAGSLPLPSAPPLVLKKPLIPPSLLLHHPTHQSKLSLLQPLFSNYSSLSISERTGFCLFAEKEKNPTLELEEIEGFEEEEDEFDFDDEEEDFDDEEFDEDDEGMLPFHKMNASLEKKPRGFGEGKVYDTSVEDKLLQEIEQSIKAQIANINKLKNDPTKPKPNNELQEVFKGVPGGIRVRINNLPKKKNIYRDLKSAFEAVPGIINISPVNSGNKKTRDPACKGLAFVDFKSLADANRFLQMFSGKIVAFGKSEKPIKCEILKPLDASHEGSSYDGYNSSSEGRLTVLEEDDDEDEQNDTELVKEDVEKLNSIERIEKLEAKLLARASLYEEEVKAKKKSEVKDKPTQKPNKKANTKPEKKPKLNIPGSAKRLKPREKAKLEDVYSRYGKREASAIKEM